MQPIRQETDMRDSTKEKCYQAIQLIEKGASIRQACATLQISFNTLANLEKEDEEFKKQYACAREYRDEVLFDQILEIITEEPSEVELNDPSKMNAFTQRKKLKADTIKWVLAKMQPKKFGDKLELNGDMNHSVEFKISDVVGFKKLEDE